MELKLNCFTSSINNWFTFILSRQSITLLHSFNHFSRQPVFLDEIDYPQQEMFTAEGEKWRRLRNIVTPSFTARRMKQVHSNPLFKRLNSISLKECEKS